jgi:hypothetical protein
MKTLLLAVLVGASSVSALAQTKERNAPGMDFGNPATVSEGFGSPVAKGTKLIDSLRYYNSKTQQYDSTYASVIDQALPIDSGFAFGTNYRADKGFAEQYDFNFKTDTTLQVLGVFTAFAGKYSSTTTRVINFKLWNRSTTTVPAGTKKFLTGFPNTALKTVSVSLKAIGIGNLTAPDTFKSYYFATRQTGINYPFYVGYDVSSLSLVGGDTFSVRTSRPGYGVAIASYKLSGTDTMITTRNAIQSSAGTWKDAYWDYGYIRNISVIPIVGLNFAVSVNGLKHNNLTFYGSYPNPSVGSTNIKYALANAADVTIQIVDLSGRTVNMIHEKNVSAGPHVKNISIADLPAGVYSYLVRTSDGDGMGSQFTVAK